MEKIFEGHLEYGNILRSTSSNRIHLYKTKHVVSIEVIDRRNDPECSTDYVVKLYFVNGAVLEIAACLNIEEVQQLTKKFWTPNIIRTSFLAIKYVYFS